MGRAGTHRDSSMRPVSARRSGVDVLSALPGPRQRFVEPIDGMHAHARRHDHHRAVSWSTWAITVAASASAGARAEMVAPGRSLSSTIASFSSSLNQRLFEQTSVLGISASVKSLGAEEPLALVLAALLRSGRALG